MIRYLSIAIIFIQAVSFTPLPSHKEDIQIPPTEECWIAGLKEQIALVDEAMPGSLGVYIKNLGDGKALSYNSEYDWYFASTTKIPLAIAILQRVENNELSLDDELILRESDYVDGNGDIKWQKPGTKYTIATLIEKSLQDSDNISTDMLIRLIGEEELNKQIQQKMIAEGINPITTILQVRHDAFSEIHKNALNLTNMDILHVNSTRCRQERLNRLMQLMAVNETELYANSIEEAFARYYQRGLNSGKLESMVLLLERLHRGELLSEEHTNYLLHVMENINTGDRRVKAGLPEGIRYAQKTGTQIESATNVGIIYPGEEGKQPIILAINVRNFNQSSVAENTMKIIGQLLTETFL